MITYQSCVIVGVGFFQWLIIPPIIVLVQNYFKICLKISSLLMDVLVALTVPVVVALAPLELFGWIPLGANFDIYKYGMAAGVLVGVFLLRFLRRRYASHGYFS